MFDYRPGQDGSPAGRRKACSVGRTCQDAAHDAHATPTATGSGFQALAEPGREPRPGAAGAPRPAGRHHALLEDGSRRRYTYPNGGRADPYFKLPYAYWTTPEAWHLTLSLPAKALLLLGMSLKPGFLPTEKAPSWYVLSSDSAEKGLAELRKHGLLERKTVLKNAPLPPLEEAQQHQYTLQAPFARPAARIRRGNLTVVQDAS